MFKITDAQKSKYESAIKEYLIFYKHLPEAEAIRLSRVYLSNIMEGNGFDGNAFLEPRLKSLAERVAYETNNYYMVKSEKEKRDTKIYPQPKPKNSNDLQVDRNEVELIKKNLVSEFPFLDKRGDLADTVDNYCQLSLQIKVALQDTGDKQSTTVKNLIDAQIRLGQYLGISEADRQKEKAKESKSSIGDLALQFENTIDEYPEIIEACKYKEIKMFLNKLERQELSKELFETNIYVGMPVAAARKWVEDNKERFDG